MANDIGDLFSLLLIAWLDHFFHHIAGIFIVAQVHKFFKDGINNMAFDILGSLQDQVLNDVIAKLTKTQTDGFGKNSLNNGLVLDKGITWD